MLGIPIEVGNHDARSTTSPATGSGAAAFELPEIALEPDEAAVVGLAARVWQHAGLAAATTDALVKLKAGGVAVDRTALDVVQPRLAPPSRPSSRCATPSATHTPVALRLPSAAAPRPPTGTSQPWGVRVLARPLVRHRVTTATAASTADVPALPGHGDVAHDGAAGLLRGPDGTDLRELARACAPRPPTGPPGARAHRRRQRPAPARHQPADGPRREGWDRLDVALGRDATSSPRRSLGYGADVVARGPAAACASASCAGCGGCRRVGAEAGRRERPRPRPGAPAAGPGALPPGRGRGPRRAGRRATSASSRRRSSTTSTCCGSAGCPGSAWAT